MPFSEKLSEAIIRLEAQDSTLTELDLYRCKIDNKDAIALANALEKAPFVTHIHLSSNIIGDTGVIAIAKALEKHNCLVKLNLSSNYIGNKGATAIATLLQKNKPLQILNLGYNSIGDEGAIAIAKALENNTQLHTLIFDAGDIHEKGCDAIADCLRKNKFLKEFVFGGDDNEENHIKVIRALEGNKTLHKIQFAWSGSSHSSRTAIAMALSDLLMKNTSLKSLEPEPQITDEEVTALSPGLKKNTTLKEFNLHCPRIGFVGATTLLEVLEINTSLEDFNFFKMKGRVQPLWGSRSKAKDWCLSLIQELQNERSFLQCVLAFSQIKALPLDMLKLIFYKIADELKIDRERKEIDRMLSFVFMNFQDKSNDAQDKMLRWKKMQIIINLYSVFQNVAHPF